MTADDFDWDTDPSLTAIVDTALAVADAWRAQRDEAPAVANSLTDSLDDLVMAVAAYQ